MYNSKNSHFTSERKHIKNSSSELPTAVKSFYPQVSPTRADLSRSIRTPSKHENQYQDVRESINYIIDQVSDKNRSANFGVEKVRQTNNEALYSLQNQQNMYTPKKETSRIVKRDYRTEGLRSTSPKSRDYQGPSEFDGGFYGSQSKKGQETDAMTENIELKKLLNDQIMRNNELMREFSNLKAQNASLKMSSPGRSGKNMPAGVLQELKELKKQNQRLRQDTIRLIQSPNRY